MVYTLSLIKQYYNVVLYSNIEYNTLSNKIYCYLKVSMHKNKNPET